MEEKNLKNELNASFPITNQVDHSAENQLRPRCILIVDDEELVATTLSDGLEIVPNCEVITATDPRQALQRFQQHSIDLLITDYKMPGMDGITLARHVRQLYPLTAIIMISAYGDNTLREQAENVAIQKILDKPVKLSEIRNIASEMLEIR